MYSIVLIPINNLTGGVYALGVTVTFAGFPSKSFAVGTGQLTIAVGTPGSVGTLMLLGQFENTGSVFAE